MVAGSFPIGVCSSHVEVSSETLAINGKPTCEGRELCDAFIIPKWTS